jgi:hypothetical protein
MLTAGGGAVVAIAVAARARRMQVIIDAFRLAEATSPARATSLAALGVDAGQREVADLVRDGILAPGSDRDTFYVDERAYILHRDARHHRARFAIVTVLMIVLVLLAAGLLMAVRLR